MQDSSPEDVEKWLLFLMQSARKDADDKRIITNDSSNNPIVYFDEGFTIDATAYLRVLEAYARSELPGSPQKGEYWIGVLERHYSAAKELFKKRTTAASKSQQREDAAAIVRSLQPTVECYNVLIKLWGHNSKDLISVVRARRWLTKLEDEAMGGSADGSDSILHSPLAPNARSYDLYLHSCSRGLGKQHKLHRERAEESERILHYRMSDDAPLAVRPTTESFNLVLRAWTRCRREESVPDRVMELVLSMERIQRDFLMAEEKGTDVSGEEWCWKRKVAPDTRTYTTAIDGWIIKAGLKANKWRSQQLRISNTNKQRGRGVRDDHRYIQAMPDACGVQDDGTEEMEKAETILKYIHDLESIGHADVNATVVGYNTLLSGWARLANELRPDVPLKSEKLLHDMIALAQEGNENAAPDVISFNAVIKAWGRTKRQNSADRCEYWLRKMIESGRPAEDKLSGENFIAGPNVATYNLCMDAHFELGDAPRVQDMLIEMDATNGLIPPNSESFSKVIRAWINDELNNPYGLPGSSVENAWRWLDELLQREKKDDSDLGPAPELFPAILKAAAKTSACGENLLTIGQWTFRAYEESRFTIDHLAYIWLLEIALKVLASPDADVRRKELVTSVFEQCCRDGLLSSKFVRTLSDGPFHEDGWSKEKSEWMCKELLGDTPFPTAWSRNLKDKRHQPCFDFEKEENCATSSSNNKRKAGAYSNTRTSFRQLRDRQNAER